MDRQLACLSTEPQTGCAESCFVLLSLLFGCACVMFATDNDCTYNDPRAVEYVGKKHSNSENMTCIMWSKQRAYRSSHFPDGSVLSADNFCRNPKPVDTKAWCYSSEDAARKWGYCSLRQCGRCQTAFVIADSMLCDMLLHWLNHSLFISAILPNITKASGMIELATVVLSLSEQKDPVDPEVILLLGPL